MKRSTKKILIITIPLLVFGAGLGYWQYRQDLAKDRAATALRDQRAAEAKKKAQDAVRRAKKPPVAAIATPSFNKQQLSVDDPNSLWVIVNKRRSVAPANYVPPDLVTPGVPLRSAAGNPEMMLRAEAAAALETMVTAAKAEGAQLMLASGYRSFTSQTTIYAREVRTYGQTVADSQSARPGHSEHQTGLGVDLAPVSRQCVIEDCFADTIEGKWLLANAWKYGFHLRYTNEKSAITGYRGESWHYRYVGTALTTEMQKQGITTLEEFFGQPPAPDYAS